MKKKKGRHVFEWQKKMEYEQIKSKGRRRKIKR